ncbi:glycoside hydrolase family 3 N-terminal domain-containing protein [Streptomyces sp. JV176]|uniref:glycoside hydrolase family 3 N-terminal domain-containing protein n=1 Tax=Streptomyces sp. JV176 TaxID=858630 RepID=UPI002E7A0987|nr:glycoside hydrolase family 3 N-terminal domain-containing protein [Streptomyces sp. JV176]MEE1800690.1 glycoside hydrolase family 3 N-terminal domain-containing protein [Streptomyces sp. JV176]
MTLEQKVAQLTGFGVAELFVRRADGAAAAPTPDPSLVSALRPHGVGHLSMAWFLGHDAESLRRDLAAIQDAVRETSPFGIGALVHNEGISGFLHVSGSQFPTAWAQAATWDPALVQRAAGVTSAHMRHSGVQLLFSPVMDINRDPRWGRVHETYGEDPELAARFSVSFVRGVQGADQENGVLATGKHFLGYGASEAGLNTAITQLGRRALSDEYAEPFRRAIAEAGLAVVMNSYNEIDGVPAAASRWLLTELLRGQLGFDGLVVSDYDAVNLLRVAYRTAVTEGDAARQAITAGLDVELPGNVNFSALADEVRSGRLDESVVDTAVSRVLTTKARVGLIPAFTPPPPARTTPAPPTALPDPEEAAGIRRSIAERGMVLLANDGVLPLTPGARHIVLVGPAADELRIHFAAYTSVAAREMPIGMRAVREGKVAGVDPETFVFTDIFQTRIPGLDPVFEEQTRKIHPDAPTVLDALRRLDPTVHFAPLGRFAADAGEALDPAAVQQAVEGADLVVAVVGERTGWVGANTAGEGQSTAVPALPGDQEELLALLAATGKPLVTVVVSGRPLLLEPVARASNAVLLAPLLGEEAGPAIASALFGEANPSGKLPSTFPRHLGQLPLYHGHHHGSGYGHPTGTRHGYGDLDQQGPLYAFGHGLSYTSFSLALDLDGQEGPAVELVGGTVRARVRVANTGPADGETVVQLYARDEAASVVRPVRQLIQFQRIALAAGESRRIVLEAPVERLHYTLPDGRRGIEAGDVTLLAGFASDDIRCDATITVDARVSPADAS